eukprot:gnl/TRDRNA2_/TRDRNA2_201663_c0_seq1.p1 gnl/TRDRNA2_/TRDRNA2_201663_c0~~gnl/TRDRNA2_/TRDRNA2_201663_c0_seq1.p1  ORF type:complete len:397 (-),score=50.52 gnl/TRDRNA2_/TRDRNA2_201663_c0_seq1:53-1096(-)
MRLLGVTLGKVLPIILLAALSFQPCESRPRGWEQIGLVFAYMAVFNYTYYASRKWSTVGCLIAGFGCYPLMVKCNANSDGRFITRYKEIGQVTTGLIVQMFVDCLFLAPSPPDLAVRALFDVQASFLEGFRAFFDADLIGMESATLTMRATLDAASALTADCDPNVEVIPGWQKSFKINLYRDALTSLRLLHAEFYLILVALRDYQSSVDADDFEASDRASLLQFLNSMQAMQQVKDHFMLMLQVTLASWTKVIQHSTTMSLAEDRDISQLLGLGGRRQVPGLKEMYIEISRTKMTATEKRASVHGEEISESYADPIVRLGVALRSILSAAQHLGDIGDMCLLEDIY